jgi:hypothetical protein
MLWPKQYAAMANSAGMSKLLPTGAWTEEIAAFTAAAPHTRGRKSWTTHY